MELPFRLTRREHPAATDALLVASGEAADLVAVCRALPGGWPAAFRVAGGFVVVPVGSVAHAVPRTVRLRRFAGDLFLPADADLVPALRPDEAVGLTRDRGLVFLPGGTVLAFDPAKPVRESEALTVGPVRRGGWEAFPPRPDRAESLHAIRAELPPSAVVQILTAGQPDDADPLPGPGGEVPEDARPPSGSLADRAAAGVKLGAGQLLNWLGRSLGAKKLAEAGADLARRAIEQVPRLSEKVLGAQEAALRELLRQLQSGDVERALRRAPIAVADPDAPPARLDAGSRLADHDTRYSLRGLLTAGSGGAAWLGGGDVWARLAAEYRRLAEEATRRGDYRRAAYLYGVLLRDPRQAARVLDGGGLHRDAAILYRDKLSDLRSAAGCFERAGCYDEAVGLYQQLELYEPAGDLLRRIGEEDAALAMYAKAAERLAAQGQYRKAGDLIAEKAGRSDEARRYYVTGWNASDSTEAVPCGLRMVEHHVQAEEWDGLRELLDEAGEKFAPPRADDAGRFFGQTVARADRDVPEAVRADVRDRARLALAEHLRHQVRTGRNPGAVVTTVFGGHPAWPGPVVRDAREAVKRALTPAPKPEPARLPPFRLLAGPVTAAVVARGSFDLVLANAAGAVVRYAGGDGGLVHVAGNSGAETVALATNESAWQIVAMDSTDAMVYLESFVADPRAGYASRGRTPIDRPGEDLPLPYLQPELEPPGRNSGERILRLHGPDAERRYFGNALLLVQTRKLPPGTGRRVWLVVSDEDDRWVFDGNDVRYERLDPRGDAAPTVRAAGRLPWRPVVPPDSAFTVPPADWVRPAPGVLQLVGVADEGALYWSELTYHPGARLAVEASKATVPHGFRAAALVGPGLVAAVAADNAVHWLRPSPAGLTAYARPRKLGHLAPVVFAVHRPQANEVVVVFADGWAVRVPKP